MADYVRHGNERTLRIVQLEAWEVLQQAESYLAVESVNGVFVGLGDLFLSSGRTPDDEETRAMVRQVAEAARSAGKVSGIAAASVDEARCYLDLGYSLVMVSNDATLFGKAAKACVDSVRVG
jgi:2-dehydro-3-deoxyglucarate aldolase/4-hydroxy-2-oxoheptanedioate aldolase